MISALLTLALLRAAAAVEPVQAVARAPFPSHYESLRSELGRACRLESHCRRVGSHGPRHNPSGARYLAAARRSLAAACPERLDLDPGSADPSAWGPRGIVGLSPAYYLPEGQPCADPALLDWPWVSAVRASALLVRLARLGYVTPGTRRRAWTEGTAATRHLRAR